MDILDKWGRNIRIAKTKPFVRRNDAILDIGCADGALFKQLKGLIGPSCGIDPRLKGEVKGDGYVLRAGLFPDNLPVTQQFDVMTMLAVLEHLEPEAQAKLGVLSHEILNPKGRVIITVPSPMVDPILDVLMKLHMMTDMSAEEHHGFDYRETEKLFPEPLFKLIHKSKFEFGLNNLYVFEKQP